LFEVAGLELEYPVVDRQLEVQHLVEPLFRKLAGRPTSDLETAGCGFSNELADHVFELKTAKPQRNLQKAEAILYGGVRKVSRVLEKDFGAQLLPTAMHPWFDPAEGRTWKRSGRRIYETYAWLFDLKGHGWMNVQSCHINLPFGTEEETAALHNAIACLLPYLPALTASSPIVEGAFGPDVDNRLSFYRGNQRRFPSVTGDVIPEYMSSRRQYKREVLGRIYAELAQLPEAALLRHEWMNSRGAIVRFMRSAIEIRILDTQECVRMDVACAALVIATLKGMTAKVLSGEWKLPDRAALIADYNATVHGGGKAAVEAPHVKAWLGAPRVRSAAEALRLLADSCAETGDYLPLALARLEQGNLSERIRRRLARGGKTGPSRDRVRGLYAELAECLKGNEIW
jgi:gamma-glutamyl:cysteine ligase YbdK (ATP-grasp superfamily)